MAYPAHALVAFGGRLASSGEQWQCGVAVAAFTNANDPTSSTVLSDAAGYMNGIQAALKTWFTKAASTTAGSEFMAFRNDAFLDWLKVNNLVPAVDKKGNATRHYADKSHSNIFTYASPGQGTGVIAVPPILTPAISWTTAKTRGPGHRGRVYLPLNFNSGQGTQTMSTTQQTQCLMTGRGLLDVLRTAGVPSSPVSPVVVTGIDGTANPITGIAVGNVIDVQRRRKEQLKETYVSAVYP
jgi:hypothetical protein